MTEEQRKIVLDNMGLVYKMLKKYNVYNKLDEYYDVAVIGLCKGAKTYDKTKGFNQSTYLCKCIQNELLMTFRTKRVKTISLDTYCNKSVLDNNVKLEDVIQDDSVDIERDLLMEDERNWILSKIDECLNKKERFIILSIYFNEKKIPQKEIATKLKVSQAQVSRIRKNALEKLKGALKE